MKALKVLYYLLFFVIVLNCNDVRPSKNFVNGLKELGWERSNKDSTLVLFVSAIECSPCKAQIEYWNKINPSDYNSLELILVVREKYESNFESYLEANKINIVSYQDSLNIFSKRDLIPFTPYKVLLTNKGI